MAQDILQAFLTARLFTVGGDDDRLDKLRAAAADVAALLKASPARAPAFTMVAIDQHIGVKEPILAEVAAKVEKHWNSYKGSFAEDVMPVVLRAVILDALARTVGSDPIAVAVALTVRNFAPHIGSAADQALWAEMLGAAEHRLELRARREWAMPSTAPATDLALDVGAIKPIAPPTMSRDWLIKRMAAASGPSDVDGNGLDDANPNWTNSGGNWSYQFAPRAAKAVAVSVDAVTKALVERINEQAGHTALVEAITNYVREAATMVTQTSIGLERRTALIWWKESLYSPGAAASYRTMPLGLAAAWMAIDAADQAGPFAPRMSEAVLLEAMRSLAPDASQQPEPLTLLAAPLFEISRSADAARQRLALSPIEAGRTPLASLIGQSVAISPETIQGRVGLSSDFCLSPADFALWLYREHQAAGANQVPKGRRRAKS